ncbi:probable polygalacturonase [Impatiens glandulifera]|uniref:probable polygalacturonase n=1 Tax=Impatiens glandulifera TaxID=253017 RepID=UPI001FB1941D|nr:probable polygalacturonase [Impatiens glandulifera]
MANLFPFMLLILLAYSSVSECINSTNSGSITYKGLRCRKYSAVLTDFGGKGDGVTLNTQAFQKAIDKLSILAKHGGAQLIVPPGKWLTGSFNLTSFFTLYIHKDAVILGSPNESDWPLIAPLPSYGVGRDTPGPRFASLIFGTNLTDVIITGGNGTIDGQGKTWWTNFRGGKLKNTRPYLIEIMHSKNVQISNLVLVDSPSWNVHPIYCTNVIIEQLTIRAPIDSPNTDGINPDSCTNVRIVDNYIVSGDDCVSVKSGWDQYGIKYNKSSEHIIIRRLTCISPDSAAVALGSEMSGGIQDVRIEDTVAINTQSAIRIKTGLGRGGFVKNIFVKGMNLTTMKYVFWITGNYGSHPDNGFNPNAMPVIKGIHYGDVVAVNVTQTANLAGIPKGTFKDICLSNVHVELAKKPKKIQWNCTNVEGVSNNVTPQPCGMLAAKGPTKCDFPTKSLWIDGMMLKTCSIVLGPHNV